MSFIFILRLKYVVRSVLDHIGGKMRIQGQIVGQRGGILTGFS
jgi:hypothetical protein